MVGLATNKNKIRKQKERECGTKKGASAKIGGPMAFPSHYQTQITFESYQNCRNVLSLYRIRNHARNMLKSYHNCINTLNVYQIHNHARNALKLYQNHKNALSLY